MTVLSRIVTPKHNNLIIYLTVLFSYGSSVLYGVSV